MARSSKSFHSVRLLEKSRVDIGKRRAISLATVFGVHPAIIMFPEYETTDIKHTA